MALAVHLAQDNVERADDGHHIGHQVAANHFVERLEIDEGRRTNAHAVGLRGAVADDVVAEFALGRFDGVVDLARRRLQDFADLPMIGPAGIFSMACRQIRRDWRISSMRTM